MAVKIKELNKLEGGHAPRFDFAGDHRTGTIGELIDELNIERKKENGELVTFKSLKRTLDFIEQVSGILIANNKDQVPLSVLKTIKLLFIENDLSGTHLFRLLESPLLGGKPTMEFSTGTTIPRDKNAARSIESIKEKLALEISPDKLTLLSRMLGNRETCSTAEKILLHIERANDEVTHILSRTITNDDRGLAKAYYTLAKWIDSIGYKRSPDESTPAHEAVFAYLDTLALQHFIVHHNNHIEVIRIRHPIGSISTEAFALCRSMAEDIGVADISPSNRHFSVLNFQNIVSTYPTEFCSLVKAATGFDTENRWLKSNVRRAKAILVSYVYRSFDTTDMDAPLLSIIDIVAALCSFRYQQKTNDEYFPYWQGQVSQGGDPQRHFDKGLRENDPHQHQGVFQIYYYRFGEYQASFRGTMESYRAWMAYQLSRLAAYSRIIQLNSIIGTYTAAISLDFLCLGHAMNITHQYSNIDL